VLRIVGHPRHPNSLGSPAAVAALLAGFRELPGHAFWPDDVSLLDRQQVNRARLLDSAHVTDSYLLALARAHHGQLPRRSTNGLSPTQSSMGRERLHLIR
jgi:uncharacterized protein